MDDTAQLNWSGDVRKLFLHAVEVARTYEAAQVEVLHVLAALDIVDGGPYAMTQEAIDDAYRFHRQQFPAKSTDGAPHPNLLAHQRRSRFRVVRAVSDLDKSVHRHPAGGSLFGLIQRKRPIGTKEKGSPADGQGR